MCATFVFILGENAMHGTLSVCVLWEAQGRNKKELKNYAFRLHYRQKYDYNELNNQSIKGVPHEDSDHFYQNTNERS